MFRRVLVGVLVLSQLLLSSCSTYVYASADSAVIIVDAGHGGEDPGAIGVNGVLEKDLNLSISMLVRDRLAERGFSVVLTREEDRLLYAEDENVKGIRKISDLKNRVKIFNSYENAIVVSIHMNSFGASKYSGTQIYYSSTDGSRALAESIRQSVVSDLQPENRRGLKKSEGLYLLENSIHPTVLVECGFLSNPEECEKLSEKEYQKTLSFSIVCGIIKYIEDNRSNME